MDKHPMVEKPEVAVPEKPKENETPKNETETETPQTEGETETPETPQEENPIEPEKSKDLQSALAQKEHFRKKAEDAEKELQTLKKDKPPESAPQGDKDEWKSKVEFLLQNQDKKYSEEEFDHIAIISSQKVISLDEAAKQEDEYIQFGREKVAKAKALAPNTNQDEVDKPKTLDERLEAAKTLKEKEEILSGIKFKDDDGSEGNINPMTIRDY